METTTSKFAEVLHAAYQGALSHLENLDQTSVAATVDLHTLRTRLAKRMRKESLPPERVLAELIADVQGGILGSAGGRFFGWVIGGSLPAALAADWLTSVWDQNATLYACGPAAAVVEEVTGDWLKEVLGLPAQASFALVSGCQMAHITCLASARHSLLASRGWNIQEKGLFGAPRIRVLCNGKRHGSIERAVRLLGLGLSQITSLATDEVGRVRPEALQNALATDSDLPAIVVLQAGDISTGACDDFETLIPMAGGRGAWVHIDGAFGLWLGASPSFKHIVKGVEEADSWSTDGHKWLNVPFDCGYAFVAHPEAQQAAMSHRAPYLSFDAEARDAIDWNPEWSRRARGFATYAALRQLGSDGIACLIERCCKHASDLVTRMGRLPGAEIVCSPTANQGLLRFLDPRKGAAEADHAKRTEEVIAGILETGEAFFTGSDWNGQRVMRVSVCNWQTSEEDVSRAVRAVETVLEGERSLDWQI